MKKDAVATTSYFPEEILQEIFLRLPRKSLSRCRCLNKSYCALFDSSSFKKSSLLPLSTSSSVSSLFQSSTSMCDSHEIVNRMEYPSIFKDFDKVEYLNSVYGFRWLRTTANSCEDYYIWDSTNNEYKKMPIARKVKIANIRGYGSGYDYKNDDYKMVRVVVNWASKCSDVDVYIGIKFMENNSENTFLSLLQRKSRSAL
ncbi:F-box protein CPR1-like [Papaver somniferum]|uniref:F-box protein CPR1-like n=1 Tax=Papaver somniferum TaxID=3469 RepID=UPI000E705CFF|nr:F-box protein CPR1-like [Papaver somniferum]